VEETLESKRKMIGAQFHTFTSVPERLARDGSSIGDEGDVQETSKEEKGREQETGKRVTNLKGSYTLYRRHRGTAYRYRTRLTSFSRKIFSKEEREGSCRSSFSHH